MTTDIFSCGPCETPAVRDEHVHGPHSADSDRPIVKKCIDDGVIVIGPVVPSDESLALEVFHPRANGRAIIVCPRPFIIELCPIVRIIKIDEWPLAIKLPAIPLEHVSSLGLPGGCSIVWSFDHVCCGIDDTLRGTALVSPPSVRVPVLECPSGPPAQDC